MLLQYTTHNMLHAHTMLHVTGSWALSCVRQTMTKAYLSVNHSCSSTTIGTGAHLWCLVDALVFVAKPLSARDIPSHQLPRQQQAVECQPLVRVKKQKQPQKLLLDARVCSAWTTKCELWRSRSGSIQLPERWFQYTSCTCAY